MCGRHQEPRRRTLKATLGHGLGSAGQPWQRSVPPLWGSRNRSTWAMVASVNFEQWFRGHAAPFAGIWNGRIGRQAGPPKAEYSSDAYAIGAEDRAVRSVSEKPA
ncbi:MAG: YjbH domain-containing protein [Gemmobacter sp.]|nr:YjbH domain-containing protein [Gemmobacter sp.]